jgi:phospholipid transport system substrate-binding protein
MIKQTTEQALTVLKDPTLQQPDNRQKRLDRLWEIIVPRFDTQEMAKRGLGAPWQQISAEQRQEFVRLFGDLVKRSYQGTLMRYTSDTQFFYDQEHVEGDSAEVQTRIQVPNQQKPFSVNYNLHRVGDQWLIYDIVVENVSLVRNYRNQFNRILNESSYDGLIQVLKKKIDDLETSADQQKTETQS